VRAWIVVVLTGCGRFAFDPLGDASAVTGDTPRDSTTIPIDAVLPPSCVGLPDTCGPSGTSSCCGSSIVMGGTFARGYDVSGDGMYPSTAFPATITDFRLDTYEVTVARFRQFVDAGFGTQANPPSPGAGAHLNLPGSGWLLAWNASLATTTSTLRPALHCDATYQTWSDLPAPGDDRPINCVTWYEAFAFCAWDGGFLPTEAQWNYAAAGGSEQRTYAWSNPPGSLAIDCSHANFTPSAACVAAGPNRVGSESPAGDGKWGQADLTGNVFEWTLDWPTSRPRRCERCAAATSAIPPSTSAPPIAATPAPRPPATRASACAARARSYI
jgi:formylglycine-generating enzyme required for sulfatase activity